MKWVSRSKSLYRGIFENIKRFDALSEILNNFIYVFELFTQAFLQEFQSFLFIDFSFLESPFSKYFVQKEEKISVSPFFQVSKDRPTGHVMQNDDIVFRKHRSYNPCHNGLIVWDKLLLLFLTHLVFLHVRVIHRLKNHRILDFNQDLLKCGNILISEFGQRDIHECEGICPLLRFLVHKLKLNHNNIVLEF